MDNRMLVNELEEGLASIPLLDAHTHLDSAHLSARGLHDVLLYHMVISDLASAGCPNRARLSEDPDDAEAEQRLAEAIPYVRHIQNTSCFWGVRAILRDLYEWTDPLSPDNWRTVDAMIRERAADPRWPREILRRTGIRRTCTELWRRRDGLADDILQYSLEWAFFSRTQWGEANDIPLYELECAWSQHEMGAPLPVTMGPGRPEPDQAIQTVDDVRQAMAHYVSLIPFEQVLSTAQHISTNISYRPVTDEKMAAALSRRDRATTAERDIYATYLLETFLGELEQRADDIVYQFSLGAEPLPYETGSILHQETILQVAAIVARHPRLRFQVFLSSLHGNQSLCTLARELPNLSVAGYWWHNFFPDAIRQVISERLDMVASNKQVGFFSDAYCADWAYAKAIIVRRQLAEVLAQKIEQGQYTTDTALEIAREILYETPQTLLGMQPQ